LAGGSRTTAPCDGQGFLAGGPRHHIVIVPC
jgi:hypothetical protein